MAVPVQRVRRTVKLDDGRTTTITSYGDEHFSYWISAYGTVVTTDNDVFHDTELSPEEYIATLPQLPKMARRNVGSVEKALVKPIGTKNIPVLLVSFPDKQFSVATTDKRVNDYYNDFFNADYTTTGNWGSVRQYFSDQSRGLFTPQFSIIGPVEVSKSYTYYGEDASAYSKDKYFNEMVKEAFTKSQALHADWSAFDNDKNGEVDLCIIIYAGYGQNYTHAINVTNTLWPKEMPMRFETGTTIMSGCCSANEMHPLGASGTQITSAQPEGVGVVIHEISHALGLPDLYDTKNVAFGMDKWSVMDYGMYTSNSRKPVGYTAYEREFMGWQEAEVVNEPTTLHIRPFALGGMGYKIVNDQNPNEYYILDNRQAQGWDTNLCTNCGHGMLVLHTDFNASSWNGNSVNTDKNHQRMSIIPANNSLLGSNTPGINNTVWKNSLQGNAFPGSTENHELTDISTPAAAVFTGGLMGKPLMDIQEEADGTITVKVMPLGTLEEPTDLHYEDITFTTARLHWTGADKAQAYNLRLLRDGKEVARLDSIHGDSYTLRDLEANGDYVCQLQAISDTHLNSKWVEGEPFRANPDGMTEITRSTQSVRVYDMNGRFVAECFTDELNRLDLHRSIYIIRHKNGKTRKMRIGR